jgi:methyltransferase (TIGR00027 family)
MSDDRLIRNISDTARWVAVYRARETERPDGLFHDPYARRLAGERGEQIARSDFFSEKYSWVYPIRTWLLDRFIAEEVARGADLVVNLAAGLDARPYRMDLPRTLRWVEIDLPEITGYKEEILKDETPRCALERVRLDLSDVDARREVFGRIAAASRRALVVSEGLLIYLSPDENAALARDLAAVPAFQAWVFDMSSPRIVKMMMDQIGERFEAANAPLKFINPEGPNFFAPHGWTPERCESICGQAGRHKRLPFIWSLLARLPESRKPWKGPWSGVCLMKRV